MSEITLAMLRDAGACEDALAEFERRFGERVTVTEELAESVAEAFDWGWAAVNLLPPAGLDESPVETSPALCEHGYERGSCIIPSCEYR